MRSRTLRYTAIAILSLALVFLVAGNLYAAGTLAVVGSLFVYFYLRA